jgi:hypothetical protein
MSAPNNAEGDATKAGATTPLAGAAVTPEQMQEPGFLARFKEFGPASYSVKHSTGCVPDRRLAE